MRKLLLLGGTLEARQIAAALAGDRKKFEATLSLAGVTSAPPDPGIPVRTGGFGGAEGLADYLAENDIKVVVDATHPFAAQISANAVEACQQVGVERLTLWRPAWSPVEGDNWKEFNGWPELVAAIPDGARVFLAAGQGGIKAIADDPRLADGRITCLARAIEEPRETPHGVEFIKSRPAKAWQDEAKRFQEKSITHLVVKNSGGEAGRAKLDAARDLGLPALLLARPTPPTGPLYDTAEDILEALRVRNQSLGRKMSNDSSESIVVLTSKSFKTLLKLGGSQSWRIGAERAGTAQYVVCIKNCNESKPKNMDGHRSAFLVGKISGIRDAFGWPGRHMIEFSKYAELDGPIFNWEGASPFRYYSNSDLRRLIDFSKLKWEDTKKSIEFRNDFIEYKFKGRK